MTLLQMSFSGAILIIVILFIRALAINRLPKQTFLILWGLALLRLLVPFTIPSPFSAYSAICRNVPGEILSGFPSGIIIAGTPSDETSPALAPNHSGIVYGGTETSPDTDTAAQPPVRQSSLASQKKSVTDTAVQPDAAGHCQENPIAPVASDALSQGGHNLSSPNRLSQQTASAAFLIWCTGTAVCAAFYILSYLRCRLKFAISLPVENTYVNHWLECHPVRRPVSVRQSDQINTPLTYGILHPVILLPRETDWSDTLQLQYVLSHEYVHIRRCDTVTKLLTTTALCLHWFNPLVWVMYLLYNRDLELACDEQVIRHFGESTRSAYAQMLIDMEAKKSGLMPLCNNFSRNAIEERITAIMKWKKTTRSAILFAAGLIIGVSVCFATSATYSSAADHAGRNTAAHQENTVPMPDSSYTEEEYAALLALQLDGYRDMTVSKYQEQVWILTDTKEYMELLERFSQSELLLDLRYVNETASFLFNIYEPLTASRWQTRDFGGYTATTFPGASDNASLEYNIFLTIKDPDKLTVGAYDDARQGIMAGLERLLQGRTTGQLQDEDYMNEEILAGIDSLRQQWGSEQLEFTVDYLYTPLDPDFTKPDTSTASAIISEPLAEEMYGEEEATLHRITDVENRLQKMLRLQAETLAGVTDSYYQAIAGSEQLKLLEETEPRKNEYATREDYRSFFTLMTPGYETLSISVFNSALLDWGNESYDTYERIREDIFRNDFRVTLTDEELAFASLTMTLSSEENYRLIQSLKTGRPREDPVYRSYRLNKEKENGLIWCGFDYAFSYHISDPDKLTVGERDLLIGGAIRDIQEFWTETSLEDLQKLTRNDVLKKLEEIAKEYSNRQITVSILEDQLYFEHMDERAYVYDH